MTAKINLEKKSLYEQDFALWLSATAEHLKQGRFNEVDLENLIEEIQSMGRSERKALKSFLRLTLEHLLKIAYWESERENNLNHWRGEILNFRYQIEDELETSPSLKNYLVEIFDATYEQAAQRVETQFKFKVPEKCPFTLEQVLTRDWFPVDIIGASPFSGI